MDEQTINDASRKLSQSRLDLWQAAEKAIARRVELEKVRAIKLLSGEIAGRNEAEREAKARELLKDAYAALEAAEIEERRTRLAYDLARIEVERIEAVIKFLSVSPAK